MKHARNDFRPEDKLIPISALKMKDKFGFRRVYVFDALECLYHVLYLRVKEQKNKQDSVYLTSGLEGSGKSMFNLWCADIYGELVEEDVPVENICTEIQDLINRMAKLKGKRSFLCIDEGSELSGERSTEKKAKETKEIFTVMRKLSHIIMVCFVNPLRIGTYFREDRVRGLFFIKKKGEIWFYSNTSDNPHLVNIIDKWKKEHDAKSLKFLTSYAPDFIMRGLPDYKGVLRDEYEARKDTNINRILDKHSISDKEDVVEDFKFNDIYLDKRKASEYTGITVQSLLTFVKRGTVKSYKIRNKIYFKKEDLDIYTKVPISR